jgi:hypothetical protein
MHLYIALSSLGRHAAYHWALVPADDVPTGIVNLYQITDPDGIWKLEHDRMRLNEITAFLGCVCLSKSITEKTEHIDAFIREFPAEQGRYRSDGGAKWSCARWIMRCLESLVEAEILELDMKKLYQTVIARGVQLEAGKGTVSVTNGVPVVDL